MIAKRIDRPTCDTFLPLESHRSLSRNTSAWARPIVFESQYTTMAIQDQREQIKEGFRPRFEPEQNEGGRNARGTHGEEQIAGDQVPVVPTLDAEETVLIIKPVLTVREEPESVEIPEEGNGASKEDFDRCDDCCGQKRAFESRNSKGAKASAPTPPTRTLVSRSADSVCLRMTCPLSPRYEKSHPVCCRIERVVHGKSSGGSP